jgi:hypothetical protein
VYRPRWLGGHIGALAVLHIWTRTLEWHPHVHLLVPAGALAPDGLTWLVPPPRKQPFLVPERALAKFFRGRFLHLARRAVPGLRLPVIDWDKRWVVFAKPVARPSVVLDYLARYVHRTALSDKAITACDHRSVTFHYRDSRDRPRKRMTLPAHEFLRRFLQHVPLRGLHRVRAFGLLHPAERTTLRRLQLLLASRNAVPRQRQCQGPRACVLPALPPARAPPRAVLVRRRLPSTTALGRVRRSARDGTSLQILRARTRATTHLLRSSSAMTPLLPRSSLAPPRATAPVCPLGDFRPPRRGPSRQVLATFPHWAAHPVPVLVLHARHVFPHAFQCMTDSLENAALSSSDVLPGFVQPAS